MLPSHPSVSQKENETGSYVIIIISAERNNRPGGPSFSKGG